MILFVNVKKGYFIFFSIMKKKLINWNNISKIYFYFIFTILTKTHQSLMNTPPTVCSTEPFLCQQFSTQNYRPVWNYQRELKICFWRGCRLSKILRLYVIHCILDGLLVFDQIWCGEHIRKWEKNSKLGHENWQPKIVDVQWYQTRPHMYWSSNYSWH
jgi:hypothetical protein